MLILEKRWNDPSYTSRRSWHAMVTLIAIGLVGCDGTVEPPAPGAVLVKTETTGFLKAEEYELFIDGVSSGSIGANDELTVSDLDPQDYELSLGQLPDHCSGGAITVAVESEQTAEVSLNVTCTYSEPATYTIQFNRERPDLDSGQVEVCPFGICDSNELWDLYVYNSLSTDPSSVIRQNQSAAAEIAHLPGVTLEGLTETDLAGATFTTEWVDDPFDADRVILIRTAGDNVYALGNPSEDRTNGELTFDAALIDTP